FGKKRKIVRHFIGIDGKARLLINAEKIDERLPPVARVAMHMLEKMQGERRRAIEEVDIILLKIEKVSLPHLVQRTEQITERRLREPFLGFQYLRALIDHLKIRRLGVGHEVTQDFKRS